MSMIPTVSPPTTSARQSYSTTHHTHQSGVRIRRTETQRAHTPTDTKHMELTKHGSDVQASRSEDEYTVVGESVLQTPHQERIQSNVGVNGGGAGTICVYSYA